MLNICKEKVQVCAGKACTTTSILPCSSLTKLWFYLKAAICPAKWPTPRIKERCSWEEIIIWLSFWPMMRKSSVMWNFWAFSSFKEKEDAYLCLFSHCFVPPGMLTWWVELWQLHGCYSLRMMGWKDRNLGHCGATQPGLDYLPLGCKWDKLLLKLPLSGGFSLCANSILVMLS